MGIENPEVRQDYQRVVYELIDPRTGEVRYVGETKNPLYRFRAHRNGPGEGEEPTPVQQWSARLADEGLEPIMRLVMSATNDSRVSRFYESVRIRQWKLRGADLLNRYDHASDEMESIIKEAGADKSLDDMEPELTHLYMREYAPRSIKEWWIDKYGSLP